MQILWTRFEKLSEILVLVKNLSYSFDTELTEFWKNVPKKRLDICSFDLHQNTSISIYLFTHLLVQFSSNPFNESASSLLNGIYT